MHLCRYQISMYTWINLFLSFRHDPSGADLTAPSALALLAGGEWGWAGLQCDGVLRGGAADRCSRSSELFQADPQSNWSGKWSQTVKRVVWHVGDYLGASHFQTYWRFVSFHSGLVLWPEHLNWRSTDWPRLDLSLQGDGERAAEAAGPQGAEPFRSHLRNPISECLPGLVCRALVFVMLIFGKVIEQLLGKLLIRRGIWLQCALWCVFIELATTAFIPGHTGWVPVPSPSQRKLTEGKTSRGRTAFDSLYHDGPFQDRRFEFRFPQVSCWIQKGLETCAIGASWSSRGRCCLPKKRSPRQLLAGSW